MGLHLALSLLTTLMATQSVGSQLLHEYFSFSVQVAGSVGVQGTNITLKVDVLEVPLTGHRNPILEILLHDVYLTDGKSAVRMPKETQDLFSKPVFVVRGDDGAIEKVC